MFRRNFLFGKDGGTANLIDVGSEDLYQPGKGYGFVTEKNRREQKLLQIRELNSSFDTMYWYQNEQLSFLKEDENGCYLDSAEEVAALERQSGEPMSGSPRRIPLIFKVDVPRQGNYRITLTIRSEEEMGEILIFTGRRRLAFHGTVGAGEFTYTMITNVCDIVPVGYSRIFADKTVDIAVLADRPRISALTVEEVNGPTVYLAGDSTVTDQPGDYVFFQFGHNDQKLPGLQAKGGYRANLQRYIKENQAKGVYPVLVTPIARNTWRLRDQTYLDLLEEFADVCLELGAQYGIPVLDLHAHSKKYVLEKGLQDAKPIFFPGDYTHTNDFGAYKMAGYVAQEIREKCKGHSERAYAYLAECVTDGFGAWEPVGQINVPKKPEIYKDIPDPAGDQVLLSEAEQLERVVRLCLKEELL